MNPEMFKDNNNYDFTTIGVEQDTYKGLVEKLESNPDYLRKLRRELAMINGLDPEGITRRTCEVTMGIH